MLVLAQETILWPISVILMDTLIEGQAGRYGYGKYGDKALTIEDKKVSYSETNYVPQISLNILIWVHNSRVDRYVHFGGPIFVYEIH